MDKSSEQYRHQCEVRALLRWRYELGKPFVLAFLSKVEQKRGKVAAMQLEKDVIAQWTLGNRGQHDVWLE